MKKLVLVLTFLSLGMAAPSHTYAQDNTSLMDQTLQDAMIVGGMGLGGAILGLSTLSFVDEPSEHLKNILVGGAIGIISGVGVVAYLQATKSHSMYKQSYHLDPVQFDTRSRLVWHNEQHRSYNSKSMSQVGYNFSF